MFQFIVSEPTERKNAEIKASGPYIIDRVHKAISGVMNDKYMRSPNYAAVTEASAFFQGGSDVPNGEYIWIELFRYSETIAENLQRFINNAVSGCLTRELTYIRVLANTEGVYYYVTEIAKQTGCLLNSGAFLEPLTFMPENNIQYTQVMTLCRQMGLNIAKP